jgi:hypothetical protein
MKWVFCLTISFWLQNSKYVIQGLVNELTMIVQKQ